MMLRRLHTYLSIASAPIVLFFCLTGCLQLFGWHEPRGAYRPPAFIEKMAMLHKKQRFAVGRGARGGALPAGALSFGTSTASAASGPAPGEGNLVAGRGRSSGRGAAPGGLQELLLRWVFLLATLCLVVSTLMGAWIGLSHVRRKRLCWLLLGAGTLLPVLLVVL